MGPTVVEINEFWRIRIRIAHKAEARIAGVLVAAPVPAVAHAPDDAAAFLQPAVGIEQLGSGDADFRIAAQRLVELVEPTWLDLGVVVQEYDIFAARRFEAAVAGPDKTGIGSVADEAHAAGEDPARQHGLIARAVVDDDDFVRDFCALLLD